MDQSCSDQIWEVEKGQRGMLCDGQTGLDGVGSEGFGALWWRVLILFYEGRECKKEQRRGETNH